MQEKTLLFILEKKVLHYTVAIIQHFLDRQIIQRIYQDVSYLTVSTVALDEWDDIGRDLFVFERNWILANDLGGQTSEG